MSPAKRLSNDEAVSAGRRLIAALANSSAFEHPVTDVEIIETHISWVILTGSFAYKIKKPVDFGFLDFSTLERRRLYCEEELRLNRRFAPDLYLELVPVRGSVAQPRLHGSDDILEYAIKMRQFPQDELLSTYAANDVLEASHIDAIAATVAGAHERCERAEPGSHWGSIESVEHWSAENLSQLQAAVPPACLPPAWNDLLCWYQQDERLAERVAARQRDGFVRECHGDLHLGNMAMIDGRITLFDCIEFNPELRWIDVVSEAAFVAMDLQARGYPHYCWRFLDRYLAASGDYAGIDLLGYYVVYRALVRAKVEALRVHSDSDLPVPGCEVFDATLKYIELAQQWARRQRRGLVLMHGLSGSGKSTVAAGLVESLGAVRLRSDIERKRLYGLDATEASGSAIAGGIYSAEASRRTYRRLAELAGGIIDAGHCTIVDAALLQADERATLLQLAVSRGVGCVIVSCTVPVDELERRLVARRGDASEADIGVLHHQLRQQDVIDEAELTAAALIEIDETGLQAEHIARIEATLFA